MPNRPQRVLFQPEVGFAIERGAAAVVEAVRPTLGPRPRYVLIQRATSGGPEILDQAGIIARRIIALPDKNEDVGAMLARHLMWHMVERVGDGAATAGVLFLALLRAGRIFCAAGGNAMELRRYLEAGAQVVSHELDALQQPVEGQANLVKLAQSVCFDAALAHVLGEIFDIVGEYGSVDIRTGRGRDLEREYAEGMFWDGSLLSRELATDLARLRGELEDAAVLVSNLELDSPHDLADFLSRCATANIKALFLVIRSISSEAMSVLVVNNNAGRLKIVAAKGPIAAATAQHDLEDMALLTGARPFYQDAGDSIQSVKPEHLGRARRAWVDQDYVGVSAGGGDPRRLRQHLAQLRTAYAASARDTEAKAHLRRRIGKLLGGAATLWIGAATESELEPRKALAERTAESLRAALIGGVLPGGGTALLACRAALRACADNAASAAEKAAYTMLAQALEAPTRTIIANAGGDIAAAMAAIEAAPAGYGYDVESGRVVDMAEAGILDVAAVTRLAVSSAISAAAMALTTDVLVHTDSDAMTTDYRP